MFQTRQKSFQFLKCSRKKYFHLDCPSVLDDMASLFPSTVSSYLHKIKLWKFPKHDLNDFRTQMGLKWLRTHLTLSDCSTQERRFCTLSGQYTRADHVNCDMGEPPLRALNAGEAVLKAEERLT